MNYVKYAAFAAIGACAIITPAASNAGSSYGFSFSTGGPAYYPAPVVPVYAPPPPPPPPVYYRPAYAYRPYYRHAPSFSFSYHGH